MTLEQRSKRTNSASPLSVLPMLTSKRRTNRKYNKNARRYGCSARLIFQLLLTVIVVSVLWRVTVGDFAEVVLLSLSEDGIENVAPESMASNLESNALRKTEAPQQANERPSKSVVSEEEGEVEEERPRVTETNPTLLEQNPKLKKKRKRRRKGHSCRALDGGNATGAWKECQWQLRKDDKPFRSDFHDGTVAMSCVNVHYRAPLPRLQQLQMKQEPRFIAGVMSAPKSKDRRDSIRQTWGSELQNRVYFVMAGEWDDIHAEFKENQDIIWLDRPERYEDLTFKTGVFLSAVAKHAKGGYSHLIKTDDDIFWNMHEVNKLFSRGGEAYNVDYYGNCITDQNLPYRPYQKDQLDEYMQKFIIDKETYPERCFPPYCFGWGYMISADFGNCIERHIEGIRFHPFEDVWVGLLAERCDVEVTKLKNDTKWEYDWSEVTWDVNMTDKVMQHPVRTHQDMKARHESVIKK